MITVDTETTGFYGLPVLIQWAEDKGPVHLHEIWKCPARETLALIEWFCEQEINGFNLAFDWFHLSKIYTTLMLLDDWGVYPEDHINELAILEEKARWQNLCLKPRAACDLMLLARKGPYQSLMARDPIKIRRVPTALAFNLADALNSRIQFDDIYFAKSKSPLSAGRWKVFDIIDKQTNQIKPDFKDIVLRFNASGALKNLYRHAFKVTDVMDMFVNVALDKRWNPKELGYAPFALAVGNVESWNWAWPQVIREHILHWNYCTKAREYARNDVEYTRRLYFDHFGSPVPGDVDSNLACMVASCRWHGYAIDLDKIRLLRTSAMKKVGETPTAPKPVMRWLRTCLDDTEKLLVDSTKKTILEEIADDLDWQASNPEASRRAKLVIDARKAIKEIELYDKLLLARRFHASFNVIGALSSRMSGSDGLNAQGINHAKDIRAAFTLNDSSDHVLCGGDFKSFEVSLAAKVFDSPAMNADLEAGRKLHAFMGMELFPGKTYDQVVASDGSPIGPDGQRIKDMYDTGKKGVFLIFYGGEDYTMKTKLGIEPEIAKPAIESFIKRYPELGYEAQRIFKDFSSLSQTGGIGTRIEYHTPKDYVESFLGFRRYFTLENRVIKALFDLASKPPQEWKDLKIKVVRRERIQTAGGAVMSALFGAAFGMQGSILRQVKNHKIQSPGADITKGTQHAIWLHQPIGVHPFIVQPMNIHDEVMAPTHKDHVKSVKATVLAAVDDYKKIVPFLAIDWFVNIPNWSSKKGIPLDKVAQPALRFAEHTVQA